MHQRYRYSSYGAARTASRPARFAAGLLAGAIALAGMGATAAQAAGHGAGHGADLGADQGKKHMAQLAEALELNADQRDQVAAILRDARETGRAARPGTRPGLEEREASHDALRDEVRTRLAEVLTPAQMSELDALREGRRAERADYREARRELRFERLSEALELHDSQQEPVRELLTQAHAARAALMREGRASGLDRGALRAELEALRAQTETGLGAILTPLQMERMAALREARAERWHEARGTREAQGAKGEWKEARGQRGERDARD